MVRKFFDKPKKSRALDVYEIATQYIKSTLILDVVSTLPQVASGLNNRFVPFKIIRLYQTWLLYYPLETLVRILYRNRDQRHIYVNVYALSTFCHIVILLHYLAVAWLFVGSDYFADHEAGHTPWQLTEDFAEYS